MQLASTGLQAIGLSPSCTLLNLRQTHFNRPGIGHGHENMKPGCTLTVLGIPSIIRPLGDTRLACSIQLSSRAEIGQQYIIFRPSNPSSQVALPVTLEDSFLRNATKW